MFSTGMIATDKTVAKIIDRMTRTFPEFAEAREQTMADFPASEYGIGKEIVFVRLKKDATKNERLKVQNLLLASNEEQQFMFWDMQQAFDELDARNTLQRFLHTLTSMVCLILGAF